MNDRACGAIAAPAKPNDDSVPAKLSPAECWKLEEQRMKWVHFVDGKKCCDASGPLECNPEEK